MSEFIDVEKAISRARERFIADRTAMEHTFNDWYRALLGCGKQEVLDRLPYDYTNMSLQTECPELYADIPVQTVCDAQVLALKEKMLFANELVNELNKENLQKLNEYNQRGIGV